MPESEIGGEAKASILDRCYAHLGDRGFGMLELATLRQEEAEAVAAQLADKCYYSF